MTNTMILGSSSGGVVVGPVVGDVGDVVTIAPAVKTLSELSEEKYMPSETRTRMREASD